MARYILQTRYYRYAQWHRKIEVSQREQRYLRNLPSEYQHEERLPKRYEDNLLHHHRVCEIASDPNQGENGNRDDRQWRGLWAKDSELMPLPIENKEDDWKNKEVMAEGLRIGPDVNGARDLDAKA